MADQFDLEAVVRFHAEGQAQIKAQVAGVRKELDSLRKSGKISEDQFQSLTKATYQTGQAMERGLDRQAGKAALGVKQVGSASDKTTDSIIRQRYALYDVATTYGAVSAAALGAVAATTTFAAKYESAFSAVERTTLQASGAVSGEIDSIRRDLYTLSTEIPIAFDELSRIASLGAQLGIAEKDLAAFTETVSKFSATTNISVDEAALAFGQLGNLLNVPASQFENLGAAIALVGVNSAATESQIVSVARELAPSAAAAGFTADQVIGLSGALASIKVPPERSRSTLLQFFETLNMAVARGGTELENFARVVGVSAGELDAMVRSGQGKSILERFIGNVSKSDTVEITQALDALGLAGLRVNPTIRALSDNTQLLSQTFADASQGFAEGVFLDQAFVKILEDASSQLQILSNAFTNFLSVAGLPFLDLIKALAPPLVEALKALTDFASTDFGGAVLGWAGGITLLIGVIFGYRATAALAVASSYAMTTAFGAAAAGTVTLRGGITSLVGALLGLNVAQGKAASSAAVLWGSLKALGRATIIIGFIQLLIEVLFNLGGVLESLRPILVGFADAISAPARVIGKTISLLGSLAAAALDAVPALAAAARAMGIVGEMSTNINGETINSAIDRLIGQLGASKSNPSTLTGSAFGAAGSLGDLSGAMGDVGRSAGGAAKQVRTLVDYANDLQSVFSRAFDIRFKSQLAMDTVADSWENLVQRIDDARIKLLQLQGDLNVKEFFLSVAVQYGDDLRAGVLQGEIADLNKQIADTQAEASTELNGNTKAARLNRKTLSDLVKQHQDYIVALAEGGADQATLNAAVNKSRAEFIAQAQALGFSNAQLQPYIASFNDLITTIGRVPRNITVTANADPALQALNEFAAKARAAGASAGSGFAAGMQEGLAKTARGIALQNEIAQMQATLAQYIASGNISGARYMGQAIAEYSRRLASGSYAEGGYTGRGGKHEPAGIVHRGEYVIPKEHVNQRTGLPYASALGQLQAGTRGSSSGGYAGGGYVNGGFGILELGPSTRSWMRQHIAAELTVVLGERQVARAASDGNQAIYSRGGGR